MSNDEPRVHKHHHRNHDSEDTQASEEPEKHEPEPRGHKHHHRNQNQNQSNQTQTPTNDVAQASQESQQLDPTDLQQTVSSSSSAGKHGKKGRMLHQGPKPYMSMPMTQKGTSPYHTSPNAPPGYIPSFSIQEGVPPGLEPLVGINSISIQQELEAFEMFMKIETNNHYSVMNSFTQRIYYAGEKTNFCARQCCGMNRPFLLNLLDGMGQVAFTVERDCNICLCCFGGTVGGSNVKVKSSRTGEILGKVIQNWSYCTPSFNIYDSDDNLALLIKGPCLGSFSKCCFMCDAAFKIHFAGSHFDDEAGKGQVAGVLTKRFALQEVVPVNGSASDATNFTMTFPADLHPSLKAVLIAAVFCIDFSYFEDAGRTCSGFKVFLVFLAILIVIIIIVVILYATGVTK